MVVLGTTGGDAIDIWRELVVQLGFPIAIACFLLWQWAEREKVNQARFADLDRRASDREAANAARIASLEEFNRTTLLAVATEGTKALVGAAAQLAASSTVLARVETSLERIESVMESGLCPLQKGDVEEARRRHKAIVGGEAK